MISLSCTNINNNNIKTINNMAYQQGTFGYDLEFLKKFQEVIVLQDSTGNSQVIISPALQGRVMTSTAAGLNGSSFGWINYKFFNEKKTVSHFNPYGGEERFWLGPEGGQYSIFFKQGDKFVFDNWNVPKEIDNEPFQVVSKSQTSAKFEREMHLVNYSGTKFDLKVTREIKLLSKSDIEKILGLPISDEIKSVGFETNNTICNIGKENWTKDKGLLSIWILSMLTPSPTTTVVVPYKESVNPGKIVNDDYFGKIPENRLKIANGKIYYKADGKQRGKIGLTPLRAKPFIGSYDAENKVLTIANFSLPEQAGEYVNSKWEIHKNPYSGDAVNSYNDGPVDNGTQMGPFYEIESSSPVKELKSGESLIHTHRTFHFKGDMKLLNELSLKLLETPVDSILKVF